MKWNQILETFSWRSGPCKNVDHASQAFNKTQAASNEEDAEEGASGVMRCTSIARWLNLNSSLPFWD